MKTYIDTVYGAEASATIYSLVETAKANKLKIYEYPKQYGRYRHGLPGRSASPV